MAELIGQCMIKGKQRGKNHGAGGIFMHVYALMDFPYTCFRMCDWIEGRIMAKLMTPFHEIILLAIAWLIPLMFPKTLDMYHIILIWIYGNKWEANLLLPNIYLMHC
jgi:hypothetical protein